MAQIQTVRAYQPGQNELDFVQAIYEDERTGKVPGGTAGQVDCIQLRKVTSATLIASPATRKHLEDRAKEFDVDPVF